MNNKNYNYRQIHPWRFQIDLYNGDTLIYSFTEWNANWAKISLELKKAGYNYQGRILKLTPQDNYYEYYKNNF